MSTVFLDPVRMDATAAAIGEHAREVETTTASLESTCSADVPAYLVGWLAEELRELAVHAQMVALLYTVAALDTALRAQQIQADQSLVTAQPALGTPFPGPSTMTIGGSSPFLGSPIAGPSVMTIGGSSPFIGSPIAGPSTMTIGGTPSYANDPLLAMAIKLQGTNPGLSAELAGVSGSLSERNADMAGTWINSRPGATYIGGGLYEGNDGRTGTLSNVYRNPDRPGEYEVV